MQTKRSKERKRKNTAIVHEPALQLHEPTPQLHEPALQLHEPTPQLHEPTLQLHSTTHEPTLQLHSTTHEPTLQLHSTTHEPTLQLHSTTHEPAFPLQKEYIPIKIKFLNNLPTPITPTEIIDPTKIIRNDKSLRNAILTVFNMNKDTMKKTLNTLKDRLKYYIFQLEKCPSTEKNHIQAYLEFKSPAKFSTIKKKFNNCHIEIRNKSRQAAINYCSKLETRIDGPWEEKFLNELSEKLPEPLIELLTKYKNGIGEKLLAKNEPVKYLKYYTAFKRLKKAWEPERTTNEVLAQLLVGKPQETLELAKQMFEDKNEKYYIKKSFDNFTDYNFEKYIIIPEWIYHDMKFPDVYTMMTTGAVNVKSDEKDKMTFLGEHIIMTLEKNLAVLNRSNYDSKEYYSLHEKFKNMFEVKGKSEDGKFVINNIDVKVIINNYN
jgi:hypothetical protein